MEITKEFKKVLIDILVRLAQTIFAALVLTPFISKSFDLILQFYGGILSFFFAGGALLVSLTIKEVK